MPTAAFGATTLMKLVAKPVAGVVTVYLFRNCSKGGMSIMNGSDVTPSKLELLEYWATSTGSVAVIVAGPVMSCSWCWPRLSVATATPFTSTGRVVRAGQNPERVAPRPRGQRHRDEGLAPRRHRRELLLDVIAGEEVSGRDVRALIAAEHADRLVGGHDGARQVGRMRHRVDELIGLALVQRDVVGHAGRTAGGDDGVIVTVVAS